MPGAVSSRSQTGGKILVTKETSCPIYQFPDIVNRQKVSAGLAMCYVRWVYYELQRNMSRPTKSLPRIQPRIADAGSYIRFTSFDQPMRMYTFPAWTKHHRHLR